MKLLVVVLIVSAALYLAACCLLYFMQQRLLYFPTSESSPPGYSAERIPSGPAVLKVWSIRPGMRKAVLYFGGNGEDVAGNLPQFDRWFADRAVYLMNYRGYGGSTGVPAEAALIADAQSVYDLIAPRHSQVAVIGRSLGSGVATALAISRPVERTILITPFDSIANVAADLYRWAPVRWLIKDPYDSARRITAIRSPVLVLIASRDEVIPRARSDALAEAIPVQLRHVEVIEGATHNDIGEYPQYEVALRRFLTAVDGAPRK